MGSMGLMGLMGSMRSRIRATALVASTLLACRGGVTGDADASAGETESAADFEFSGAPTDAYARVDRLAMPGVNTALITSKDEFNAGWPDDDADFAPEIVANVTALHAALDDDIVAAGLVPCVPAACVETAASFVVPDLLRIDPAMPAGFPNGRRLTDPVMDVVLALLLLDLAAPGQTPTTFAELPLNPPANDVAFRPAFPFLAQPHRP